MEYTDLFKNEQDEKQKQRNPIEENSEENRQEQKIKIAIAMLPMLDDKTIASTAGLSIEEVQKLRTEHKK